MRKVVLDTETTGINFGKPIYQDHYIIEIGAIELIDRKPRNTFQRYIRAPRESTPESFAVHGLSWEFLKNSPDFKEISHDFIEFIKGAELIIHNAAFDLSFINAEFFRAKLNYLEAPLTIETICPTIIDTLRLARKQFPNRKNSLDVLCQRFGISTAHRVKHGALLDSELLLHVYLALTGGQKTLFSFSDSGSIENESEPAALINNPLLQESSFLNQNIEDAPKIAYASQEELLTHEACLQAIKPLSCHQKVQWLEENLPILP